MNKFLPKFILFSLLCLQVIVVQAQPDTSAQEYQPGKFLRIPKEMLASYAYQFGQWGQKNTLVSNKAKSEFVKFVEYKVKFLQAIDSAKLLMHDDSITIFLNKIKSRIIDANESLKGYDCRIFTLRSLEPNAFNLGEGIILFSIGLLDRLSTPDQVAAIIAHEMSHDILDHVFVSNQRLYREWFDKGFRKNLKLVSRSSVGRSSAFKRLTDEFLSQHMSYKRAEEITADSLGFILSTNAGFDPADALEALRILDEASELRYQDSLKLQNFFDFNAYPFKSHWLDTTNAYSEWKADSLLVAEKDTFTSHPDCDARIQALKEIALGRNTVINDIAITGLLDQKLKTQVAFEVLSSIMLTKDYSLALYVGLQMLNEFPDNVYLKTIVAHCLVELWASFLNNEYLDFVQFPHPEFEDGFNHYLNFLHNMNSATLRDIAEHYLQEELDGIDNQYIAFIQLLLDSGKEIEVDDIKSFEAKYNDPYLNKLLRDKWIATQ